jgi:hypothetical protein
MNTKQKVYASIATGAVLSTYPTYKLVDLVNKATDYVQNTEQYKSVEQLCNPEVLEIAKVGGQLLVIYLGIKTISSIMNPITKISGKHLWKIDLDSYNKHWTELPCKKM